MKKVIFLVLFLHSFLYSAGLITIYATPENQFVQFNSWKTTATTIPSPETSPTQYFYLAGGILNYNGNLYQNCTNNNDGTYICSNAYYTRAYPSDCPEGTVLNSENICSLPSPDDDGDGTPDKCDFDHPDYSTADCDNDGIPNENDGDIDGDGNPNDTDLDDNNDDIIDYTQDGGDGYTTDCQGPNHMYAGTLAFPSSQYQFWANYDNSRCSDLVFSNPNIDSTYAVPDKNDACNKTYCYVHLNKNDCDFDSSWYRPNNEWDYIANKSEEQCNLYVDDIRYSASSYSVPDSLKCPTVGFCYLKRIKNDDNNSSTGGGGGTNSEENDPSMEAPDLNSTTSDLSPLLNAQNTANKHLQDLKDKTDISNDKLEDLKTVANNSLNVQQDSKNLLSGLKTNSDLSLSNQANGLAKLASIGSSLTSLNKTNKAFSDVSTYNQGIGNGFLGSIDGKMTTNNNLLTDIKDSLLGDGSTPDTSANDGFSDLLSSDSDFIDFVTNQFSDFQTNINSNFTDIETQYANAKSLFENPLSAPNFSGSYNTSCFSFNVFGKHVVLDMSILSLVSPVIYFIFMLTFMVLNFRFLLNHLLRGDN